MMKIRMKYLILLLAVSLMAVSCGKEKDPGTDPEIPDWNKTRTTTVLVYGRMDNSPLLQQGSADVTAVSGQIRSTVHSVALLNRTDVVTGGLFPWNPVVVVGASAKRVPLFAHHSFKEDVAEGTGVLIGHTYTKSEIFPITGGTSFLKVDTKANAVIPMTFGTVTVDRESQITSAAQLVKTYLSDGTVVAGFVSKTMAAKWKGEFPQSQYRFETIESANNSAALALYVVSTSKWVLRESSESSVGSSGISVFNLQIEALP